MSERLDIQLKILQLIPTAPRRTSVKAIIEDLDSQGFSVRRRSVERFLNKILDETTLPIERDKHRPAGWCWSRSGRVFVVPGMSAHDALTFVMLREQMRQLLPRESWNYLQAYFAEADKVVESLDRQMLKNWRHRVAVLPEWMRLQKPELRSDVVDAVYEAVLKGRRCRIHYQKRGHDQRHVYIVDPLGLVFRGERIYLVCSRDDDDKPVQLLLHRMQQVEVLTELAQLPKELSLHKYISEGGFNYGQQGQIDLAVRFVKTAAAQLYESPLSHNQQLSDDGPEHFILRARVVDDWQLHWWLFSFADKAEVLEPAALRRHFAETSHNMCAMYKRER